MLKDEKEWERFRDLTGIMENTSPMQPSEDFTAKVMARLPEEKVPLPPAFYCKQLIR